MPKASVNGINLAYSVSGQGDNLLMIMGFSSDRYGWIFQRGAFKKHFRVITFDNRGVGRSDKPGGPYSVRTMADDAVGLLDHLDIDKAHVLGVSMGGMIAQQIAINHPARVRKLILGCTFAGRDETSGIAPEFPRALGYSEYTDDDVRRESIWRLVGTLYSLAFNRRLYRMIFVPLARIQSRLNGATGLVGQLEAILAHDALVRLHTITAPTLVIAGTRDCVISPGSSEVLAGRIPNARLVTVEDGSHAFFMETRGRFNQEVLGFLRDG